MLRIAVKITKFSLFVILLYYILARMYWIGLQSSKHLTQNNLEEVPEPDHNATTIMLSQNKQIFVSKTRSGLKFKIQQKKGHGWNKIIHQRRKDFGSLVKWSSEPDMKKVLLWTGYGPLQEGMLLWRRVLSHIGIMLQKSKGLP